VRRCWIEIFDRLAAMLDESGPATKRCQGLRPTLTASGTNDASYPRELGPYRRVSNLRPSVSGYASHFTTRQSGSPICVLMSTCRSRARSLGNDQVKARCSVQCAGCSCGLSTAAASRIDTLVGQLVPAHMSQHVPLPQCCSRARCAEVSGLGAPILQ